MGNAKFATAFTSAFFRYWFVFASLASGLWPSLGRAEDWGDLSQGKFYKYSVQPSFSYPDSWSNRFTDGTKLTDGETENALDLGRFVSWWGVEQSITLDLGRVQSTSHYLVSTRSQTDWGIFFPQWVRVETSEDGYVWRSIGMATSPADTSTLSKYEFKLNEYVLARYVRFSFPKQDRWIMVDEIKVWGTIRHTQKLVPESGAYYGAYNTITDPDGSYKLDIPGFETKAGHPVKMTIWYVEVLKGYREVRQLIERLKGRHLIVSLQPSLVTSEQIAHGALDDAFEAFFREAAEHNVPLWFDVLAEMNADWFKPFNPYTKQYHGGDPVSFRQAYMRIYNIAEQVGATGPNHVFVWSPASIGGTDESIRAYYPGPTYVDWLGAHPYGTDNYPCQQDGLCLAHRVAPLRRMEGNKKPLIITEGGCRQSQAEEKLRCVQDWFGLIKAFDLKGIIYEHHMKNIFDNKEQWDAYRNGFEQNKQLLITR